MLAPSTSRVPLAATFVAVIAAAVVLPVTSNVLSNVTAPVTSRVPAKSTLAPVKEAAVVLPDFNIKLPLLLVRLAY